MYHFAAQTRKGLIFFQNILMLHSRNTYTTIDIYTRKHSQHNKDEQTRFFRKIYLSLYSKGLRKGYVWEVSWRLNKDCNILTPCSSVFCSSSFSFCWAAQLSLVLSASNCNNWLRTLNWLEPPVAPGYIIVWHPPASVSVASAPNSTRPQSRLPPPISSTGCICYLHRCISYLTARPGRG